MPKDKKPRRGKSVSLYLDSRTAGLYDEVRQRGENLSQLLGELLQSKLTPTTALATVQSPFYPSLDSHLDEDSFRFEKWLDPENVKHVILMGTTLYAALLDETGERLRPLWPSLLEKKVRLSVLLQGIASDPNGQFSLDAQTVGIIKGQTVVIVTAHSKAVQASMVPFLKEYNNLEVRLATQSINYSAFLLRGKFGNGAVQMHPYTGMNNQNVNGVRFNFSANAGGSGHYAEAEHQISAVWKSAVPLK